MNSRIVSNAVRYMIGMGATAIVTILLSLALLRSPSLFAAPPSPLTGAEWLNATYNLGVYSYSNTPSYSGAGTLVGVTDAVDDSSNLNYWIQVGWYAEYGGPKYQYSWSLPDGSSNSYYLNSSPAVGSSHAYEVEYLGNNQWGVYIDFTQVAVLDAPPGSSSMFAGICGSPLGFGFTTFSDQTNDSLEYLASNGSWYYWSNGQIIESPNTSAAYTIPYYDETDSES